MTVLEIDTVKSGERYELKLKGRVDALGSRNLEDEIKLQMKSGRHELILDFGAVDFVSSAGIRVFIKYYKELKALGGALSISEMSEMVTSVFEMAGLSQFISRPRTGLTMDQKVEAVTLEQGDAVYYLLENRDSDPMQLETIGLPAKLHEGGYTLSDASTVPYPGNKYGLALGALSSSVEDAAHRFGEMLGVGEALIYLPTDGSKSVDYLERSGQMIPEAIALSAINFQGEFSKVLGFRAKEGHREVTLEQVATDLLEMSDEEAIGLVMVAEATGLVGCSLNVSPVNREHSPFTYPQVKDEVSFTIEPEYDGHMAVITGIVHQGVAELLPHSTPLANESGYGHFHAAVFGFHPLQKNNTDLDAIVRSFLDHNEPVDVLHLLNDDRPLGIGQSCFTKGTCWMGSVQIN